MWKNVEREREREALGTLDYTGSISSELYSNPHTVAAANNNLSSYNTIMPVMMILL